MAQSRYYSSVAQDTSLSATITGGATTLTVAATTGFPASFPYTLVIEPDTAKQEIVTVTAAAGLTLTVTRGEDGTAAIGHDAGAVVQHSHSARDFRESRQHEDASTAVHGIADTSALVVTTDPRMSDARTPVAHQHSTNDITSAPWVAFTPSWTASTTNPTIGNGSITGVYRKIGRTTHFSITITMGTTTTYGSGGWNLSLPVTSSSQRATFSGIARDTSAASSYLVIGEQGTADSMTVRTLPTTAGAALGNVLPTAPFTWADGDQLRINGTYEAAS